MVASSSSVGASGVDENARAMEAPRRESPMSRDYVWLRPRAPSRRAESTRTQGPWRPHVGSHQCRGTMCGCVLELRRGERSRRERKGHGGPTSGVTNVEGLSVCHEAEE